MERTIFIGDVHGCLEELKEMVKALGVGSSDRVICLGDLVNKGPDSIGVIRYVYSSGFKSVVGNHDLKYRQNYLAISPYHDWYRLLEKEIHSWYVNLPFFIEEEDFIVVHAGMVEKEDLNDCRKTTTLREIEGRPWHHFYKGKKKIVYGHWAKQGFHETHNTICLDGGCVYGGKLLAYVWQSKEVLSVQAKKAYVEIGAEG